MLIDVQELLHNREVLIPVLLEKQLGDTWNCPDVVEFLSPVVIEGTLSQKGEDCLILEAEGSVEVLMECNRCLKEVSQIIPFDIEECFVQAGKEKEAEQNDENEAEIFSGFSIDCVELVKKNIVLALPMKCICDEDCKGLCSVCGQNLNEDSCNCDAKEIDPRFEGLMAFFKDKEDNE